MQAMKISFAEVAAGSNATLPHATSSSTCTLNNKLQVTGSMLGLTGLKGAHLVDWSFHCRKIRANQIWLRMAGTLVRALAGPVHLLRNPRMNLSVKKNLCFSVCCFPKADGVLKLKMWCPSFYMLTISVEMILRLKVKRIWGKANHEGSLKVGQGNSTGLGPDPP